MKRLLYEDINLRIFILRIASIIISCILIGFFIGCIFCKTVFACESYEECMGKDGDGWSFEQNIHEWKIDAGFDAHQRKYTEQISNVLTAIAYKLDEISKKLDSGNKAKVSYSKP